MGSLLLLATSETRATEWQMVAGESIASFISENFNTNFLELKVKSYSLPLKSHLGMCLQQIICSGTN